jgi:hypothetical protein
MTAVVDPPVNGAIPAAMAESRLVGPVSAASSSNKVSEQAMVQVTRVAAVLITVVIAVASCRRGRRCKSWPTTPPCW